MQTPFVTSHLAPSPTSIERPWQRIFTAAQLAKRPSKLQSTRWMGVYKISTKSGGECYIGASINIRKRWQAHISQLRSGNHYSANLRGAAKKHGLKYLTFEILELVDDEDRLLEREQFYMDAIQPQWNRARKANSWFIASKFWKRHATEGHLTPEQEYSAGEFRLALLYAEWL